MRSARYERLSDVLTEGDVMLRLAERLGRYGIYDEKSSLNASEEDLPQRHRAALNAHSQYFRETFTQDHPPVPEVEPFLENEAFIESARRLYGRSLVRPLSARAKLMLPGQELALHTDVPEFRGLCRERDPAWLMVAMHHSGLFDDWRIACATGIAWFGSSPEGGEFVFYPDGPYGRSVAVPVRHNTAIVLDTDSLFHGVDRLPTAGKPLPPPTTGMELRYGGDGAWVLDDGKREVARYEWSDLRFSVSWRAHCFSNSDEEDKVREHKCDLSRERALEVLTDDLRTRGRIGESLSGEPALSRTVAEEYIKFPPAAPSGK